MITDQDRINAGEYLADPDNAYDIERDDKLMECKHRYRWYSVDGRLLYEPCMLCWHVYKKWETPTELFFIS